MKATTLFVVFYEQIGSAYLQNRPTFISSLFKAAGCTHEIATNKATYADSDYRFKICNGSKPISIKIKRSFPDGEVNLDGLVMYFAEYIRKDADRHCPALMKAFTISEDVVRDVDFLAIALAKQFKTFIDEKDKDEVDDVVADNYLKLIQGIKKMPSKPENAKIHIDELIGVDRADQLEKNARERLECHDNKTALKYLFDAWRIFVSETGESSNDTKLTLNKLEQAYKLTGNTQSFEQWLQSEKQSW